MEKQNKVLNKIKHSTNCGQKTPLGTKPNDECYTGMQDILNELSRWAELGKFKGKNIICPCDWDIVNGEEIYSIQITYKDNDVEVIGNNVFKAVKDVCYDLWEDDLEVKRIHLKEDEIEDFLRDKLTCNFLRTFTQSAREWGIKSITASGYNPANGKGIPFQDVDYSKYDICVTNPPFSLYAEFMDCIVDKIDFICLAPSLNRVTPNIGLPLMLKKCYLGFSADTSLGYLNMNFYNPTSQNEYHTKNVGVDWITSFSEAQDGRNERLKGHKTYVDYKLYKDEYQVVEAMTMKDGTHPIRVPGSQIPDDYNGWMFAPINVLTRISFDEFEWYGTNFMKYYNTTNPAANPFNHKTSNQMVKLNGKKLFHGIVLRRKVK